MTPKKVMDAFNELPAGYKLGRMSNHWLAYHANLKWYIIQDNGVMKRLRVRTALKLGGEDG